MSSSDIIAEFQANLVSNYMTNVATTLVCYEYIFSLKHELALLWRRKWTGGTWLFAINRYSLLVATILTIAPANAQTCYSLAFRIVFDFIELLPFVVTAVFSALRVYALLGRNRYIPSLILLLGLVPAATNAYLDSQLSYYFVNDPILGASCYFNSPVAGSTYFHLATRLSLIAADALVLIVTWTKTYSQVRQADSLGINVGLSATLLRDGGIYFVIILILNILQLLIDIVPGMENANPVSAITQVMPSILISRFIINLRQVDGRANEHTVGMERFSQFSIPNFRVLTVDDIVGNLGEPLEHSGEPDWTEENDHIGDTTDDTLSVKNADEGSPGAQAFSDTVGEVTQDALIHA